MEKPHTHNRAVVITGEAGTWYPVPESEATARVDAELNACIQELVRPHIAAERDYYDQKYGTEALNTRPQRVAQILRRILR